MRQLSMQHNVTSVKLKKAISNIYKKISKTAKKGLYEIKISRKPWWLSKSALDSDDYCKIVENHFGPNGFYVTDSTLHGNYNIYISWYPEDVADTFRVCEAGEELKHLILTGKAPEIVIGDEE